MGKKWDRRKQKGITSLKNWKDRIELKKELKRKINCFPKNGKIYRIRNNWECGERDQGIEGKAEPYVLKDHMVQREFEDIV